MPVQIADKDEDADQTRTVRPVGGPKSIQSCVSMPVQIVDKDEDADQIRTVSPVGGQQSTQLEEININFRVPGLSLAVVKEAENFPRSRARQKDRRSSSSRSTSSRLAAE